jgi:ferrous-iron efflux pump FieF
MNASEFVSFSKPRQATLVAAATALLLVAVKLTVGLLTGTVTVMASAADSMLDFLVSSFNVFAVHNTERPSDASYNYGRGKIEGVAASLEGLFILASALYILREAVLKFRTPTDISDRQLVWAMAAMGFSVVVTLMLTLYLRRLSTISRSLIVKADSVHYQTDLLTNGGVVIVLGIIHLTGWVWLDPVVGIAISIYVAQAAIPLVRKGLQMLLDRALEDNLVTKIR